MWDVFGALPGRIADGSTAASRSTITTAGRHDLALLAELGVGASRMSLSWSRIQPKGAGPANPAGLAFYDRVIDRPARARDRAVRRAAPLGHAAGGHGARRLAGRDTADAFADYAALAADAFGDRVDPWSTLKDPLVQTGLRLRARHRRPRADAAGRGVPGRPITNCWPTAGLSRSSGSERRGSVGIVNHHTTVDTGRTIGRRSRRCPVLRRLSQSPIHRSHPRRKISGDHFDNAGSGRRRHSGRGSSAHFRAFGFLWSQLFPPHGDCRGSGQRLDSVLPGGAVRCAADRCRLADHPASLTGSWSTCTAGIRRYLRSSSPVPAGPSTTGSALTQSLPDSDRIAFLDGHLDAIAAAVEQGCDVRGYFHWSLLDSWEWAEGFTRHFGLVRVDQDTLDREPRASFAHYRELIRRAGCQTHLDEDPVAVDAGHVGCRRPGRTLRRTRRCPWAGCAGRPR